MSYLVKQHIPGYFDLSTPPEEAMVSTIVELLTLPFVARWREREDFSHWALEPPESFDKYQLLMAILKDGKWWVVAYIDRSMNLPDFPLPPYKSERAQL